jgi:cell division transport system permease protein
LKRLAAQLLSFLRAALRGISASPLTSGVAIATIGVSLVLVGAFALLVANMQRLLDDFGDALHVTAFLEDGLSEDQQRQLAATAATVEGMTSVRLVGKQEALERFRDGVGRGAALLEGLSTSGRDWVEGYLRAIALVRGVGWGLAAILALATLLIVANTIRLAVLSRRDELEILALVGASRAYVGTPFLIEGLIQGAAGGALALLLLYAVFRLVLPGFEFGLELVLGGVEPRFFTAGEAASLLAAGAGLGLFGAGAALASEARP